VEAPRSSCFPLARSRARSSLRHSSCSFRRRCLSSSIRLAISSLFSERELSRFSRDLGLCTQELRFSRGTRERERERERERDQRTYARSALLQICDGFAFQRIPLHLIPIMPRAALPLIKGINLRDGEGEGGGGEGIR